MSWFNRVFGGGLSNSKNAHTAKGVEEAKDTKALRKAQAAREASGNIFDGQINRDSNTGNVTNEYSGTQDSTKKSLQSEINEKTKEIDKKNKDIQSIEKDRNSIQSKIDDLKNKEPKQENYKKKDDDGNEVPDEDKFNKAHADWQKKIDVENNKLQVKEEEAEQAKLELQQLQTEQTQLQDRLKAIENQENAVNEPDRTPTPPANEITKEKIGGGEYELDGTKRAEDALDDNILSKDATTLSKDEQLQTLKAAGINVDELTANEAADKSVSFSKDNTHYRVVNDKGTIKIIQTNIDGTKATTEVFKVENKNKETGNANPDRNNQTDKPKPLVLNNVQDAIANGYDAKDVNPQELLQKDAEYSNLEKRQTELQNKIAAENRKGDKADQSVLNQANNELNTVNIQLNAAKNRIMKDNGIGNNTITKADSKETIQAKKDAQNRTFRGTIIKTSNDVATAMKTVNDEYLELEQKQKKNSINKDEYKQQAEQLLNEARKLRDLYNSMQGQQ